MITITNIRNVKKEDYDEIWAIVRYLKSNSSYLIQVKDLSPSPELYSTFRHLQKEGNWNEKTFNSIYRPRFLDQIRKDQKARSKLNELYLKDKAGKSIALVCFCTDVNLCHRKLISEMLTEKGIKNDLS